MLLDVVLVRLANIDRDQSKIIVGIPLEGERLHPYTLGTVSEDKCHGKEQIYTRAKDPDCTGINQNQHKHSRTVPQVQCSPTDVS